MITQIKNICKVDDIKNADCIIFHVGDLNTSYENAQLKSLKDNMDYARLSVESKDRYTGTFNGFKNQDSGSLIDHIFFGGKSIVPKEYWVDKTNYGVPFISDHYPVLFKWKYK
jgi:endonuclease/exonuclease/phosphatase family metal-dependent hydrolase